MIGHTDGNAKHIHMKVVQRRFVEIIDSKDDIFVSISPSSEVGKMLITSHPCPR